MLARTPSLLCPIYLQASLPARSMPQAGFLRRQLRQGSCILRQAQGGRNAECRAPKPVNRNRRGRDDIGCRYAER